MIKKEIKLEGKFSLKGFLNDVEEILKDLGYSFEQTSYSSSVKFTSEGEVFETSVKYKGKKEIEKDYKINVKIEIGSRYTLEDIAVGEVNVVAKFIPEAKVKYKGGIFNTIKRIILHRVEDSMMKYDNLIKRAKEDAKEFEQRVKEAFNLYSSE